MKKSSIRILIFILGSTLIFTGCSETQKENQPVSNKKENYEESTDKLKGSVNVDSSGTDTVIHYTFKNMSNKTVVIYGGASYLLLKDQKEVEKGSVPIKDYIDLHPGEEYRDKKTFTTLQPGEYTVQVEWSKTTVTTKFTKK